MSLWCLIVKVQSHNSSVIYMCAIYKSHLFSKREFCLELEHIIGYIQQCNTNFIIFGDFNINWLDYSDTYRKRVAEILNDNNLILKISEPTRITPVSRTLIDYVLTNNKQLLSTNIDPRLNISDHETIEVMVKTIKEEKISRKRIKYCQYDKNIFVSKLERSSLFLGYRADQPYSLNALSSCFSIELKNVINSMVKIKYIPYENAEWFNIDLQRAKTIKTNLYKKAVIVNSVSDWNNYRHFRNIYKQKIRQAKSRFIKRKIENANSQKDMWRQLKKYVLNKGKDNIVEVQFNNGVNINESAILCEEFNKFFVQSILELHQSLIFSEYVSLLEECNIDFKFRVIDVQDIISAISLINKKK